jgi:hypothetical protein
VVVNKELLFSEIGVVVDSLLAVAICAYIVVAFLRISRARSGLKELKSSWCVFLLLAPVPPFCMLRLPLVHLHSRVLRSGLLLPIVRDSNHHHSRLGNRPVHIVGDVVLLGDRGLHYEGTLGL